MAIIMHIDFNSFFASVEQQANPFLRNKALVVGGKKKTDNFNRAIVAAASYQAKQKGIKTGMPIKQAKKLLPNLIIIPADPAKYAMATNKLLSILQNYTDQIEQFSVDEAFVDLTKIVKDYMDATILSLKIKRDIINEVGQFCPVSIGISSNKLMAKIASNSDKPNGLTVIPPHKINDFILHQPLKNICGIGSKTAQKLASIGVNNIKDLRAVPLQTLKFYFKNYGIFLYNAARGRGDYKIYPNNNMTKSISHSYTFAYDLELEAEIHTNLLAIADKVARKIRQKNLIASTIAILVKTREFKTCEKQITLSHGIN
ncbi:DNA polymerase IV, partial [Candidatus Parcubacteria bacterium]